MTIITTEGQVICTDDSTDDTASSKPIQKIVKNT